MASQCVATVALARLEITLLFNGLILAHVVRMSAKVQQRADAPVDFCGTR